MTNDLFYFFDRTTLIEATSSNYRKFLKEADYADINNCQGMLIGKYLLGNDLPGVELKVTQALRKNKISKVTIENVNTANEQIGPKNYIIRINQVEARQLADNLGSKLPTVGLMYRLFIPYLKNREKFHRDATTTLYEMRERKAEWLEDEILDKNKVKIGEAVRAIKFPESDGSFDKEGNNDFGYPTSVKKEGEFRYWYPNQNYNATARLGSASLDLSLGRETFYTDEWIGLRLVKFV